MIENDPVAELRSSFALEVQGIKKTFGRDVPALRGIDLEVTEGEFLSILGPSGSGKTTLLMILAGLENPTAGRVLSRMVDITQLPPERRNFGVVFQSYALFPHMTVFRNVAYPLDARRVAQAERQAKVEETLELVGLSGLGRRRPNQLSGGQQQRVALARALVYRPAVLLLDEPLGALDRALREQMQIELRGLNKETGVTFVYVTHDQEEALTMSDRVAVMREGLVEQLGSPEQIYIHPASRFVGEFVGDANFLDGQVTGVKGSQATLTLSQGRVITASTGRLPIVGTPRTIMIRPERIAMQKTSTVTRSDLDNQLDTSDSVVGLPGKVLRDVFAGNLHRYIVGTECGEIAVHSPSGDVRVGEGVHVSWTPEDAWLLPLDRNELTAVQP